MESEFKEIISKLNEILRVTTNRLKDSENFNANSQGQLNNLKKRINALETSALEIEMNYSNNPQMKINFKIRANQIKQEIQDIS